eukprot:229315_1
MFLKIVVSIVSMCLFSPVPITPCLPCWNKTDQCAMGNDECPGSRPKCVSDGVDCVCLHGDLDSLNDCTGAFNYKYEILDQPLSWFDARNYCETVHNSALATISTVAEFECVLDQISTVSATEPAFLLLSHQGRLFYDNRPCPREHNLAWCPKLALLPWADGIPIDCAIDGSRCVRVIPEQQAINNDVPCEETLNAVLCNPENSL